MTRLRPAREVPGDVVVPDVDLQTGAELASRTDMDRGIGIGSVDQPALEDAPGPRPRGPGVGDPVAPYLAGPFDHRAEPRITLHHRPGGGQVERDRQRVGRTLCPASPGNAAPRAENPDPVADGKVRSGRCRRAKRLEVGRVGLGGGRAQRKAFHDALDAPVSPVVEEVGRDGVVEGMPGEAAVGPSGGGRRGRVIVEESSRCSPTRGPAKSGGAMVPAVAVPECHSVRSPNETSGVCAPEMRDDRDVLPSLVSGSRSGTPASCRSPAAPAAPKGSGRSQPSAR